MNNEEIRKRIKDKRKAQQLSQSEMAEKLSISQTAYYKIEKGDTHLISDHLPKLASILQLPEEELVFGYETQNYAEIIKEKNRRIAELESIIADKDKIIALQSELLKKF
ncbi:MAG TPA: helix-turn-helix domain-containing protein [Candidatus Coprenecus stercoravium]|uniref:Helix-turn-helix domain-containing protein n=1 Tax=Candidatus Coprenecus stercoravium TaxID=2840735 RepID=A0A9D2K9I8_9BACT|nr:helix-turn-helix domain-containing protein [Candidatus Coprenecus stercoravium]